MSTDLGPITISEVAQQTYQMGYQMGVAAGRKEIAEELQKRLVNAQGTLRLIRDGTTPGRENTRLNGKTEGLQVALSYVEEYLR